MNRYATKRPTKAQQLLGFRIWLCSATDAALGDSRNRDAWSRDTGQTVRDVANAILGEQLKRSIAQL